MLDNTVLLSGTVVKTTTLGENLIEALVEVEQRNNENYKVKVVNCLFTTEQSKFLQEDAFVVLSGILAERRVGEVKEGEKANTQVYVLVNQILYLGQADKNGLATQSANFTIAGQLSYVGNQQYNANGTPVVRVLLKNKRFINKTGSYRYTTLPITFYKELEDLKISKGEFVVVSGRLDSYMTKAGYYQTEGVGFSVVRESEIGSTDDVEFKVVEEKKSEKKVATKKQKEIVENTELDVELGSLKQPFNPQKPVLVDDELPF